MNACVARGLSVVQGDADTDLHEYPSHVFDVVILSLTIQATRNPKRVLGELLRIGNIPRSRCRISGIGACGFSCSRMGGCRAPRRSIFRWYDTPNIHLCTIADFVAMARETDAEIKTALALREDGETRAMRQEAGGRT